MQDDLGHDVLSHVLDQTKDDELKVVADQVRREAASGRSLDEAVTEAQFALGMSFADAKRVEAFAQDGMDKSAGLKSTLRKLRQQLNKHDNEDLEGMARLITCIEGVEKQLEKKQKAKDERSSKKKPAEAPADEEKEAEAAAAPVPPGTPGDLPLDQSKPDDAAEISPIPSPAQMAEHGIDLVSKMSELNKKLKEAEDMMRAALNIGPAEEQFQADKPLLIEALRQIEGQRILMEKAEKKWSVLLVEQKNPTVQKGDILDAMEKRIVEAAERGTKFAKELLVSLSAMKNSPAYQKTPAPSIQIRPTPADFQKSPHTKAPSEQPKQSSRRAIADGLESLLSGLADAVQDVIDFVDIAEMRSQPAV